MLDNTDLNCEIIDTILIDQEDQAEFIVRKLEEDAVVTEFMKDALKLYKQNYRKLLCKKLQTNFNKLNEKQKQLVLLSFGESAGSNTAQRKSLFKKFILKRTHSMEDILQTIQRNAR